MLSCFDWWGLVKALKHLAVWPTRNHQFLKLCSCCESVTCHLLCIHIYICIVNINMYILQLSMFRFRFFFCRYSNSILQLQDGQPNSFKNTWGDELGLCGARRHGAGHDDDWRFFSMKTLKLWECLIAKLANVILLLCLFVCLFVCFVLFCFVLFVLFCFVLFVLIVLFVCLFVCLVVCLFVCLFVCFGIATLHGRRMRFEIVNLCIVCLILWYPMSQCCI